MSRTRPPAAPAPTAAEAQPKPSSTLGTTGATRIDSCGVCCECGSLETPAPTLLVAHDDGARGDRSTPGSGTARRRRGPRERPTWEIGGAIQPYVERLIAPGVINTMPEQTLHAFADHGDVEITLGSDLDAARAVLAAAAAKGVDLDAITRTLERDGVKSFCDSYEQLLSCIEGKRGSLIALG